VKRAVKEITRGSLSKDATVKLNLEDEEEKQNWW
jgi:hypothetical protein